MITETINVAIDKDVHSYLKEIADKKGVKLKHLVSRVLEDYTDDFAERLYSCKECGKLMDDVLVDGHIAYVCNDCSQAWDIHDLYELTGI